MPLSMYDASVPVYRQMLGALSAVLTEWIHLSATGAPAAPETRRLMRMTFAMVAFLPVRSCRRRR